MTRAAGLLDLLPPLSNAQIVFATQQEVLDPDLVVPVLYDQPKPYRGFINWHTAATCDNDSDQELRLLSLRDFAASAGVCQICEPRIQAVTDVLDETAQRVVAWALQVHRCLAALNVAGHRERLRSGDEMEDPDTVRPQRQRAAAAHGQLFVLDRISRDLSPATPAAERLFADTCVDLARTLSTTPLPLQSSDHSRMGLGADPEVQWVRVAKNAVYSLVRCDVTDPPHDFGVAIDMLAGLAAAGGVWSAGTDLDGTLFWVCQLRGLERVLNDRPMYSTRVLSPVPAGTTVEDLAQAVTVRGADAPSSELLEWSSALVAART